MRRKYPHELSLIITGKIGIGLDQITGQPMKMVYQRVRKGGGNIDIPGRYDLQLRKQSQITDKKSAAQLKTRARITAATAAWKSLSVAERNEWKSKSKSLAISGYNLFIREYCNARPVSEF